MSALFCLEVFVESVSLYGQGGCTTPAVVFRLLDFPAVIVRPRASQSENDDRHCDDASDAGGAVAVGAPNGSGEHTIAFSSGKSALFEYPAGEAAFYQLLGSVPLYVMLIDSSVDGAVAADSSEERNNHSDSASASARLLGSVSIDLSDFKFVVSVTDSDGYRRGSFSFFDLMGNDVASIDLVIRLQSVNRSLHAHFASSHRHRHASGSMHTRGIAEAMKRTIPMMTVGVANTPRETRPQGDHSPGGRTCGTNLRATTGHPPQRLPDAAIPNLSTRETVEQVIAERLKTPPSSEHPAYAHVNSTPNQRCVNDNALEAIPIYTDSTNAQPPHLNLIPTDTTLGGLSQSQVPAEGKDAAEVLPNRQGELSQQQTDRDGANAPTAIAVEVSVPTTDDDIKKATAAAAATEKAAAAAAAAREPRSGDTDAPIPTKAAARLGAAAAAPHRTRTRNRRRREKMSTRSRRPHPPAPANSRRQRHREQQQKLRAPPSVTVEYDENGRRIVTRRQSYKYLKPSSRDFVRENRRGVDTAVMPCSRVKKTTKMNSGANGGGGSGSERGSRSQSARKHKSSTSKSSNSKSSKSARSMYGEHAGGVRQSREAEEDYCPSASSSTSGSRSSSVRRIGNTSREGEGPRAREECALSARAFCETDESSDGNRLSRMGKLRLVKNRRSRHGPTSFRPNSSSGLHNSYNRAHPMSPQPPSLLSSLASEIALMQSSSYARRVLSDENGRRSHAERPLGSAHTRAPDEVLASSGAFQSRNDGARGFPHNMNAPSATNMNEFGCAASDGRINMPFVARESSNAREDVSHVNPLMGGFSNFVASREALSDRLDKAPESHIKVESVDEQGCVHKHYHYHYHPPADQNPRESAARQETQQHSAMKKPGRRSGVPSRQKPSPEGFTGDHCQNSHYHPEVETYRHRSGAVPRQETALRGFSGNRGQNIRDQASVVGVAKSGCSNLSSRGDAIEHYAMSRSVSSPDLLMEHSASSSTARRDHGWLCGGGSTRTGLNSGQRVATRDPQVSQQQVGADSQRCEIDEDAPTISISGAASPQTVSTADKELSSVDDGDLVRLRQGGGGNEMFCADDTVRSSTESSTISVSGGGSPQAVRADDTVHSSTYDADLYRLHEDGGGKQITSPTARDKGQLSNDGANFDRVDEGGGSPTLSFDDKVQSSTDDANFDRFCKGGGSPSARNKGQVSSDDADFDRVDEGGDSPTLSADGKVQSGTDDSKSPLRPPNLNTSELSVLSSLVSSDTDGSETLVSFMTAAGGAGGSSSVYGELPHGYTSAYGSPQSRPSSSFDAKSSPARASGNTDPDRSAEISHASTQGEATEASKCGRVGSGSVSDEDPDDYSSDSFEVADE